MRILIDADACPVRKSAVALAKRYRIPVWCYCDTAHRIEDGYSRTVTVDKGADSVDFKLIQDLLPQDIVVTQDYGVAALALGKGAAAIHQNGWIYTEENIDRFLFERHLGGKIRRSGGRTKGPAKRTKGDDAAFETAFLQLIELKLEENKTRKFL